MSEEKKKIFGSSGAFVPEPFVARPEAFCSGKLPNCLYRAGHSGPCFEGELGNVVPLPPEPVQIIVERWWRVNPNYRYVEMLPGSTHRCCVRLYEITEADPPFQLMGEGESDMLHEAATLAVQAHERAILEGLK